MPPDLEALIMQMLETEPEDRPDSAMDVFVRLASEAGMRVPLVSKERVSGR